MSCVAYLASFKERPSPGGNNNVELQSSVEVGYQICVRAPKKQIHVKNHKVTQAGRDL